MLPDKNIKCPATGFARSCREIIAECDCPKFVTIRGKNPQGGEVDQSGCVDGFLPVLLIENAQVQRQTGAAIESFRNEVAKGNANMETARRDVLAALGVGGPRLVPAITK